MVGRETRETVCWKCQTPNVFVVTPGTTRVNCRNGCGAMLFSRTPEGTAYVIGSQDQANAMGQGGPLDDRPGVSMTPEQRAKSDDLLKSVFT